MRRILFIVLLLTSSSGASIKDSKEAAVHVVTIDGMNFVPKSLEINMGETVRWVNETDMMHNVIANDKSFRSEMLTRRKDIFEYTFEKEGEFRYYCQPHRMMGMKGMVIVKK